MTQAFYKRRKGGFTLIELMIVVAIVGLLGTIAIPSFTRYQNRARRSESFTNLASLAKSQRAFFAEYGYFTGAEMVPTKRNGGIEPGPQQRDSTTVGAEFATVGWYPEGQVFFDYDTNTGGFANCICPSCFTSTAYGDVDGDGSISLIIITHPNIDQTQSCTSLYFPTKGIPQIRNGSTVYDEPVLAVDGDDF
jgi:prepilin-type N-terminal cleavage/methylation domain-containing protein